MADNKDKSRRQKREAPEGYFARTKQLSLSFLYILPLLMVYEVGVILLDPTYENGAGAILKLLFYLLGGGAPVFNALLIVAVVIAYIRTHQSGGTKPMYLVGIAVESIFWALVMLVFAALFVHLVTREFHDVATDAPAPAVAQAPDSAESPAGDAESAIDDASAPAEDTAAAGRESRPLVDLDPGQSQIAHGLVKSCGAGVYEEIVFRLILMTGLCWVFARLLARNKDEGDQKVSVLLGVLVSGVLFAAAHHIPPQPAMTLEPMVFRTVCGFIFGLVFIFRGLAVAVYTHTVYDIYVFVIQPMLFPQAAGA